MQRGFTLFFAILVGSLALAVGLAIYDLTVRELQLSAVATQSQYAIYAADTGAECALYWDSKCSLAGCVAGSAFATSSNTNGGTFPPAAGINCNNQVLSVAPAQTGASAATTTFTMFVSNQTLVSGTTTCASVTLSKSGNPAQTLIVSHGYNTCQSGPLQLERVLQVTY